jgi:hypothetical protein
VNGLEVVQSDAIGPTKKVNRVLGVIRQNDKVTYRDFVKLFFYQLLILEHSYELGGNSTQAPQLSYEIVVAQTPHYNSTVYVGNLTPSTTRKFLTK